MGIAGHADPVNDFFSFTNDRNSLYSKVMDHTKEHALVAQIEAGVNYAKRTIYITGDVEPELAHTVIVALEALDAESGPIRIVLNSSGGDEQDGYAIYDAIMACNNVVLIEGYGNILSIAAAIFQAGDSRRLSANSALMVHNGTAPTEEGMKQNLVMEMGDQLRKDNQKYYNILASASGQSLDVVEAWCHDEKYFNAKEAVEAGLADEIIKPIKKRPPPRKRRSKKP